MKRSPRNSIRYKSNYFRITTSGVREGGLDAEVLDARVLQLTTPEGVMLPAEPAVTVTV